MIKEANGIISYTLTRSKRKTCAIHVKDGIVDVRAPLKMPKSDIDKFVTSKEKWITNRLSLLREHKEQQESFSLNYGDSVLYCGKQYIITPSERNYIGGSFDGKIGVSNHSFYIPPNLSSEQIKHACVQIYRILAKSDLTIKVYDYASKMVVMPTAVKINGATTQWGSCSVRMGTPQTPPRKNLNFSWRLIMADDEVIDYVVVHELAHIIEMNHSARFWAIVEKILPDYRERQSRLKELQKKLNVENWE